MAKEHSLLIGYSAKRNKQQCKSWVKDKQENSNQIIFYYYIVFSKNNKNI